ncbi:MAG: ABC transporter substrate-binding protein [Acidobacteriota bacterium]
MRGSRSIASRRAARLAASAALAALSVVAAGCGRSEPALEKPLRIALYNAPLTLDPHRRNELLTFAVLRNIYDGLTAFDAGAKVGPALAERWENPNDVTWVFHLRPGVRFHDGRPLTAADVVFSLERARHNPGSNVGSYLVAIDRIRAVDPRTVEITTAKPYPILLNKLAFVLIVPDGSPAEIREPVGTGPYRLVRSTDNHLELEAFPGYWGAPPSIRRVEFVAVPSVEERVRLLLGGGVDIAQEPGVENVARIRNAPGCRILEEDSLGIIFLIVRKDRPPFDDIRVRQAINLALDRATLVKTALQGEGVPAGQMVGRNVFGYAPDIPVPKPDLERARRLLAEAGHPNGLDVEIQFRPGRRAELEPVARQLAAVGVRLRLVERPWAELFPALVAGDVNFYFGGWFCLSADASDLFDATVHSRTSLYGASNFNHYVNPQLDREIEESARTVDLLARRRQLEGCMHLLMDDLAFIPLYSPAVVFGARSDVAWQVRRDGLILAATIRRQPAER